MDNLRGALLMIFAMAGFAIEDAFIKAVTARLPEGQVLLTLGAGSVLIFAVATTRARHCAISRDIFHPMVLLRSSAEIVGSGAFVIAITLVPLAMASAILQATPLFVALGAILFFGERVGWRRWVALVLGLLGVLVILRPGFGDFRPEALFALAAAIGLAVRDLATRHRPAQVHTLQLATWGFAALTLVGAVMLALGDGPLRPTPREAMFLAAALVIGAVAYYALMLAVQAGEVGFVTPFRYTRLIFAMILAWAVFAEWPDTLTLIGGAIVVGSGLYTLIRERRMARKARQTRILEAASP